MSTTAAATAALQHFAAERAVNDPAKLAKAVRTVRLALARERVSLEDLISARVDERIRASVEAAPPLPADLESRLGELIRSARPDGDAA